MILVWHDVKSFYRHLETMSQFRQLHRSLEKCGWNLLRDMPVTRDIRIPLSAGGARRSFDLNRRGATIPLGKIGLHIISQN